MIEREITGYKWININAANAANASVKTALGIPVSPDAVTQEGVDAEISYKENGDIDFYFFEGYLSPLGNTQTFTVRQKTGIE